MTETPSEVPQTEEEETKKSEWNDLEIVKFFKNIDWDEIGKRIRNGVNTVGEVLKALGAKIAELGEYLSKL